MSSIKKNMLLHIGILMAVAALAITSCTDSDVQDLPLELDASSSSAESLGIISSPSARSSSSATSSSEDAISCLVGANCIETSQTACATIGGTHVPYCPALNNSSSSDVVSSNSSNSGNNASSSSSSNAALPVSSSSSVPNVLCVVGTGCLELPQNICVTVGAQVSSCPAVTSSSSLAPVVPSSSSTLQQQPSSSSRAKPTLESNGDLSPNKTVDVYSGDCVDIILNWYREYLPRSAKFVCNAVDGGYLSNDWIVTVNGASIDVSGCGSNFCEFPLGEVNHGLNSWSVCIAFVNANYLKCNIGE